MGARKRGRVSKPIQDDNGNYITGLSYHKGADVYYASGTNPRIYFGRDKVKAIFKFRQWQGETENKWHTISDDDDEPVFHVSDSGLRRVAEFLRDPQKRRLLAKHTGFNLEQLDIPSSTIPLSKALNNWKSKVNQVSKEEQKQVAWAWSDFQKHLGNITLSQVTREEVVKWIAKLVEKYAPKTIRNRICRIRTVLRYNLRNEIDVANCERIIRYLLSQDLPSSTLINPKPISRVDFQKLLKVAQSEPFKKKYPYLKPMLLTALNCAYYAIDLCRLPISAVNLSDGHIVFAREKKNTPRVAVLWARTVKALSPIIKGRESRQFVFETYRKGAFSKSGLQRIIDKLKKDAHLPNFQFSSIRDGALSACGKLEDEAKRLAGHRAGQLDQYAMRNPSYVANACKMIERHYFPEQVGK